MGGWAGGGKGDGWGKGDDWGKGGKGEWGKNDWNKKSKLLNMKDSPVHKLKDTCTKDEFMHWKRSVECHLESTGDWSGATKLLQQIRRSKVEVDNEVYEDAVDKTIEDIDASEWRYGFEKRSRELYMFLIPKLNTNLSVVIGPVDNMNGMETWRLIMKEEDPIHKNEAFHMELDVRQLSATKCKNFKETMDLIMKLERKAKVFRERNGILLSSSVMKQVLWGGMDVDTLDLAEIKGYDAEETDYKTVKDWLIMKHEQIVARNSSSGGSKKKGNDDMDVSELTQSNESPTEETENDNQNENYDESGGLSAFGKGGKGGKGGGRPMQCFTCGGEGHPARMCPTTDPGAKHTCNNCKGTGHFGRDCTSKGGGKAGQKADGKGDGKGYPKGDPKGGGFKGYQKGGGYGGSSYGKGGGKYGYGKGGKGGGYGKGQILEMGEWAWPGGEQNENQPWMTGNWNEGGMFSMAPWGMPRSLSSIKQKEITNNIIHIQNRFEELSGDDFPEINTEEKSTKTKMKQIDWKKIKVDEHRDPGNNCDNISDAKQSKKVHTETESQDEKDDEDRDGDEDEGGDEGKRGRRFTAPASSEIRRKRLLRRGCET